MKLPPIPETFDLGFSGFFIGQSRVFQFYTVATLIRSNWDEIIELRGKHSSSAEYVLVNCVKQGIRRECLSMRGHHTYHGHWSQFSCGCASSAWPNQSSATSSLLTNHQSLLLLK